MTDEQESSIARSSGAPERVRREDGAGRREPHPAGEEARGNVEPEVDAPEGAREIWTPERGTEKTDPGSGGKS
jgi:hypothetical protein